VNYEKEMKHPRKGATLPSVSLLCGFSQGGWVTQYEHQSGSLQSSALQLNPINALEH